MAHKINFNVVLLVIWLISPSLAVDNGLITHEDFCYEDESCGPESDDWGSQCQRGERQSPIDLPYIPHRHNRHVKLEFNDFYCSDGNFQLHNTHKQRK